MCTLSPMRKHSARRVRVYVHFAEYTPLITLFETLQRICCAFIGKLNSHTSCIIVHTHIRHTEAIVQELGDTE